MIEPVSVPIILDLELSQVEYDLSVEEAEEYAAQIGSLVTVSEVYGGLPSGGSLGNIIIKNSEEDYDASWYAPASIVEEGNGLPVTSEAVYDAIISSNPKPYDDSPAALGTANPGHSELYARGDHVHLMPRAADIGAYTKPSDGIPASDLADDVHLIPSGGTIGQILRKISNNDWDIDWGGPIEDGNAIWLTSAEPSTVTRLGVTLYYYSISDLSGADGRTPQSGDIIVKRGTFVYAATSVFGSFVYVNGLGSIKGDPGQDGVGVPSGGTTGQLLVKQSDSDYNVAWISPADSAEQDNTRPITAAAVYTEIGNINILLATI